MNQARFIIRSRAIAPVLAIMFLLFFSASQAPAGEPVTVKIKVIMSGPPAEMLPAGDDANHYVGLGRRTGEAEFSDGRKAKYSNVFVMDVFRGEFAKVWGYTKMAFQDDAWIYFKWDAAMAGLDEKGNPTFAGDGTLQKGTGMYEGITGTVKFTNRNIPPNEQYPNGATEANAVLTYTLPAQ